MLNKYANVYPNIVCPIGKRNTFVWPNVIISEHIGGFAPLLTNNENPYVLFTYSDNGCNGAPTKILIAQVKIKPTKYINPLKSWLNKDANEKKHTNINGDNLRNKYMIDIKFNSI